MEIKVLKQALDYDSEIGALKWRERPREHFVSVKGHKTWNAKWAGKSAGSVSPRGRCYVQISLLGKKHTVLMHRLIWAITYECWPNPEIDHVNGDPADNRLINLREVTHVQNSQNKKRRCDNTSGFTGVKQLSNSRWRATIISANKRVSLGCYATREEAAGVRDKAKQLYHPTGRFAAIGG
jgi:hypothetical protein